MTLPAVATGPDAADLVLVGGVVHSLARGGDTVHEALAVRDGHVARIGSDREVAELVGASTRVLDLAGRTAVPGFIETHSHPSFYGLTLRAAVDAGSPPNDRIADIIERVHSAVDEVERGTWIRGYRYDDTLLADCRHPSRDDLDPVSPHHPVCLLHVSAHFCVLNSVALGLLGIDAETPDPPGGAYARDESGRPTGLLIETAAFDAFAAMPATSLEDYLDALGRASDSYLSHGVTTVHDLGVGLMGGSDELRAYAALLASGRPAPRFRGYVVDGALPDTADTPPDLTADGALRDVDPEAFRVIGAKMWADGSIQGLTGCLSQGYACAPDKFGMLLHQPDDLAARVATLTEMGLQVAVHGNGDHAIDVILEAYRRLGSDAERDLRPRIEHAQMATEGQLDAMVDHRIFASFFVKHVYYWGDRHRDRFLGPDRARRISPLASAKARGMHFGLHSDTPVVPVAPLEGMWIATNRQTRDGHELGPEQRVDPEVALRAYTSDAGFLSHEEDRMGTLTPGSTGDIAVLDRDVLASAPTSDATVSATVVAGRIAFERKCS